jgi:hypothetical protein
MYILFRQPYHLIIPYDCSNWNECFELNEAPRIVSCHIFMIPYNKNMKLNDLTRRNLMHCLPVDEKNLPSVFNVRITNCGDHHGYGNWNQENEKRGLKLNENFTFRSQCVIHRKQQLLVGFRSRDWVCFLWDVNWILTYKIVYTPPR